MLTAIPDHGRRLADGVLVEASIRARVLGIRLLTVEATVVLAPADVTAPARHESRQETPARFAGVRPRRSGAAGRGLAAAVRNINEGAELLAEARPGGS